MKTDNTSHVIRSNDDEAYHRFLMENVDVFKLNDSGDDAGVMRAADDYVNSFMTKLKSGQFSQQYLSF